MSIRTQALMFLARVALEECWASNMWGDSYILQIEGVFIILDELGTRGDLIGLGQILDERLETGAFMWELRDKITGIKSLIEFRVSMQNCLTDPFGGDDDDW